VSGSAESVLIWTTSRPSRVDLRRYGFHAVSWRRFRRTVATARTAGAVRSSLVNPAAAWLGFLAHRRRIALLDAPCRTVADLCSIHGYLVEPGLRRRCWVLVHAERALDELDGEDLVDPAWRYPWTLERLRHLAASQPLLGSLADLPVPPPVAARRRLGDWLSTRWRRHRQADGDPPPPPGSLRPLRLDPQQCRAVRAGGGVVQVIAPAGSGKTTVLIERVKELLHRGAVPQQILCTSFNRDAKTEIAQRLQRAGVQGVEVRSFHGLGRLLLAQEGRLRSLAGGLGPDQWRGLAERARQAEPGGVHLDPRAAQEAISTYKLALMLQPADALARTAGADPRTRTAARLYALYEDHLAQTNRCDFDDLIAHAVALLQQDAAVRRRWQDRFTHVLVDEYQDIEPAQALLVGLLAAPQDALFCVGDEDQCIYAWRRATVQRVIELDQVYPGLERHPLVRNYRCGAAITAASRRLIEHNRQRFCKPLLAGVEHAGEIRMLPVADRPAGAAQVASLVREGRRGEMVVLARTSALLREVARACDAAGVPYAGPAALRRPLRCERILAACLQLCAHDVPRGDAFLTDADQVARCIGLVDDEDAPGIVRAAVAALRAADLAGVCAAGQDALPVVTRLRGAGGLDRLALILAGLAAADPAAGDALEALTVASAGRTVAELAAHCRAPVPATTATDHAVEFATIHGAKGREWAHVVLFGIDQGQMPHARSLAERVSGRGQAVGGPRSVDGVEDERRLCYVALTRACRRLDIVFCRSIPSQFLVEAGLVRR
jgi:DNA helicase II / ATP-dependent DNA helicase PcrA